jgi:hypothetical protein
MLTLHPERIVAIWFRSGSAFGAWSRGEIPVPELTPAVYAVPVFFNGGAKEVSDPRHGPARVADRAMFKQWREHGAPACFATDPRTGHECGESRYLAIPFFDECLALRLPREVGGALRPLEMKDARWAPLEEGEAKPDAAATRNSPDVSWVPGERFAKLRAEYLKTGATSDTTPPPAPTAVTAKAGDAGVELTWTAEADFESGLQAFIIEKDGRQLAQLPEKPAAKFGRPLFQGLSYGDTPDLLPHPMRFTDPTAKRGEHHDYRVLAVNSAGLKSAPAPAR